MKKILYTIILGCACAMPMATWADSDVTKEKAEQNTPAGWTAVELPNIPAITSANTIDITSKGASTSSSDNTKAIQAALDAVPSTGGMVVIPAGEWLCGPIKAKSKTVLHLAAGATLKLLPYGTFPKKVDTSSNETYDNFIDVKDKNVKDVIIEGEDKNTSIIEGQGGPWWDRVEYLKTNIGPKFTRGAVIRFTQGSRFMVRNLKIQNSPGTNIGLSNSNKASHCTVHDVIIREPASDAQDPSHNTDGISVWGQWMNIYNCDISNGDDNVVVDSDGRNVHVWNCSFGEGHGASIGSYTVNTHDILWEDIDFNGTDSGFRMKSKRGRSGEVYNITMRNCTMQGVNNPVYIECWYDKSTKPEPASAPTAEMTSTTPQFRDILIQNITSTGTPFNTSKKAYFPIYIYGLPESHVKNVTFDNVKVQAKKGMFLAYADDIKFINGCNITNTNTNKKYSTDVIATQYEATISGNYETTGIDGVNSDERGVKSDACWNLAGQKVGKDYKGIVIKNGKKYIQR